jgi:hypothetical protein
VTPALLRECGEALYGDQWMAALARDLEVSDRTMRRWVAGDFAIPPTLTTELRAIMRERGLSLAAVRRKLR